MNKYVENIKYMKQNDFAPTLNLSEYFKVHLNNEWKW